MRRMLYIFFALIAAAALSTGAATRAMAWGAEFAGPGPGVTGNSTGGIFPYRPADPEIFQQIAEAHCARFGRLGQVTSIHRIYGDYVSFVCYDRPGMIH